MIAFDWSGMLNIFISVAAGSAVATIIVWKLVSYFVRKAFVGLLTDHNVQEATTLFIESHIVKPFNSVNNEDVKILATEALEIALKKIKEKNK